MFLSPQDASGERNHLETSNIKHSFLEGDVVVSHRYVHHISGVGNFEQHRQLNWVLRKFGFNRIPVGGDLP